MNKSTDASLLERRVWELLGNDDVRQAIDACETLNFDHPTYAPGWHAASHLALKVGNSAIALSSIDKALSLQPGHPPWLLQKAVCLSVAGEVDPLHQVLDELESERLQTKYQCATLASLLTKAGRREAAASCYESVVAMAPDDGRHFYNLACVQRSLGRIESAERNFDRAVELDPHDYESYKIRSELRKQTAEKNHVAELEGLLQQDFNDPRGKVNICYALSKELEDLGEFSKSFHYLNLGARTRRSYMKYDVRRDLETMSTIVDAYGSEIFAASAVGHETEEPIFILGMPRTGTTLVERILSSHSEVFAAGELNNFAMVLMQQARAESVGTIAARDEMVRRTTTLDFEVLGKKYLASTRPETGHSARFIDKMPLNYLYAGLIHRALPRARIINLRRNPMDTIYAVYKQLFVDAYPFSYDLQELAEYYVAYHKLMEHWNRVMPGVIYTVDYETLVGDLETEARSLLSYCDLDWQDQCLRFYENPEASTTASTVQVRKPIYRSSVGKWQNFEAELGPAVEILAAAGIAANG